MINFLYCFDENYIKQATTSIYSLLSNTTSKINLIIIYKKDNEIENLIPDSIKFHGKLNKIFFKAFDKKLNFPNLNDVHVSEATYYRLFIDDFIDLDIHKLVYLDSDIICINNFEEVLNKEFKRLFQSKFTLSAKTEFDRDSLEGLKRFGVEGKDYFNAGVLLIDYKKWKTKKTGEELINLLKSTNEELLFWDQDLLNIYFDGQFSELNKNLNYKVPLSEDKFKNKNIDLISNDGIFLHYSGKFKPWSLKGALNENAKFYHIYFRKIFNEDFHIYNQRRLNTLKDLIKNTLNLKIFKIEKFFIIMKFAVLSLVRKGR